MRKTPETSREIGFAARALAILSLTAAIGCSPNADESPADQVAPTIEGSATDVSNEQERGTLAARIRPIIESKCQTKTENLPDGDLSEWGRSVNRRLTHINLGCAEGVVHLYNQIHEQVGADEQGPFLCTFWRLKKPESDSDPSEISFIVKIQSDGLIELSNHTGFTTISSSGVIEGDASGHLGKAAVFNKLEHTIVKNGKRTDAMEYLHGNNPHHYLRSCK